MAVRRSRPMFIAPAIPLWGILAFFGAEQLQGTRYLTPFVILMALVLCGLFAYVVHQATEARRARPRR